MHIKALDVTEAMPHIQNHHYTSCKKQHLIFLDSVCATTLQHQRDYFKNISLCAMLAEVCSCPCPSNEEIS